MDFGSSVHSVIDSATGTATALRTVFVRRGDETVTRTYIMHDAIRNPQGQPPPLPNHANVHNALSSFQEAHTYESNVDAEPPEPPHNETTDTNATTNRLLGMSRPLHIQSIRNSSRQRISVQEQFINSLNRFGSYFHLLDDTAITSNPSVRVVQVLESKWTFGMLTALMKCPIPPSSSGSGYQDRNTHPFIKPFGGILWQTASNPPKAVCITFTYEMDSIERNNGFFATCSCSPSIKVNTPDSSCCEHLHAALDSTMVSDMFRGLLYQRCNGSATTKFGSALKERDEFPIIHFIRLNMTSNASITNVPKQSWSFYTQFDTTRQLFVPLVLVKTKKVQCLLCRGHRTRRGPCEHEIAWEKEVYGSEDDETTIFDGDDSDQDDNEQNDPTVEGIDANSDSIRRRPSGRPLPLEKYCRTDLRLPLLPCNGILWSTFSNALKIETNEGRNNLVIWDEEGVCAHCKRTRTPDMKEEYWLRSVRLYTLTQQVRAVQIEDWKCLACGKKTFFSGVGVAIYPSRKTYCFTYELLYYFVHNVCRLGISFRAQYDSYHMTQVAQSTQAKYDNFSDSPANETIILEDCQSGRRRCAEAFGNFLHCIDTNNPDLCDLLFTCKKCEVELTRTEKQLLGYPLNDRTPVKAFRALAFDGTTAGILHSLPTYERSPIQLTVANALKKNQRFITSKLFQVALATLVKVTRHRVRLLVNRKKALPSNAQYLTFALPTKKDSNKWNKKKSMIFNKDSIGCIRKLLCGTDCLCNDGLPRSGSNQPRARSRSCSTFCKKINNAYRSKVSGTAIQVLLQSVITLEAKYSAYDLNDEDIPSDDDSIIDVEEYYASNPEGNNSTPLDANHQHNDEQDEDPPGIELSSDSGDSSEDDDDDDEYNPDDETATRTTRTRRPQQQQQEEPSLKWFLTVKIPHPFICGQLIEAFLDLIELLFTDNVCLSYIRPSTDSSVLYPSTASFDQACLARTQQLFHESGNLKLDSTVIGFDSLKSHNFLVRSLTSAADCSCETRPTDRNVCHQCIQRLARATVAVSETNPVLARFTDQILLSLRQLGNEVGSSLLQNTSGAITEHMDAAKNYFSNIADNLSDECKDYWNEYANPRIQPLEQTTIDGREGQDQVGESQATTLSQENLSVTPNVDSHSAPSRPSRNHNAEEDTQQVPSRDVIESERNAPRQVRSMNNPSTERLSASLGTSNTSNAENTGTSGTDNNQTTTENRRVPDHSARTGMSFPGRPQCRPLFTFDHQEGKQCGKRYAKNSTHSPGLITAICVCGNPKLIGFIIMTRAESTALALSTMLMFFPVPPFVLLYDNACNTIASALLRLPWLLLLSFIIVDRFHYKGHTCNAFYDADRYRRLDNIKTSAAESVNAKIKRGLYNMRFLKGDVLIYYLNVRFSLLNLTALHYEKKGTADVEDVDLNKFYSELVPCNCNACKLKEMAEERFRTEFNPDASDQSEDSDSQNEDGSTNDQQEEQVPGTESNDP